MANYIRRKKQENKFTVLPNSIFSAGMTLQATGLLCYLLHLPGDWKVRKTELFKNFKNGRDATIKAFNELLLKGYIEEIEQRTKAGKFSGNDYYVYDEPYFKPITENQETVKKQPFTEKPFTDNPFTEKPFTENQELINNISNNNDTTKLSNNTSVLFVGENSDSLEDQKGKEKNSAKKENKLYPKFIEAYYLFYQELNGIPPKIDGAGGNAAKQIISYLKTVAKAKDKTLGDDAERLEAEVVKMIEYIFINWRLVRPFLQNQYNLMQINSNLNNIMADIKATPVEQRKKADNIEAYNYFKNYSYAK